MPPGIQQQLAPLVQQYQQLPEGQRQQAAPQLAQQINTILQQSQQQGQPQEAPQQGMVAQAADEDLYAAAMQGGAVPEAASPASTQPQGSLQGAAQDTAQAEASAIEAKNELDNVKVTLTVRELLDLVGKGTATASLLKVKQLADTHQQKMDQSKQKAEVAQQQAQQTQQQEQQGMMGGGIYPTPMGG